MEKIAKFIRKKEKNNINKKKNYGPGSKFKGN